eukprot:CFRG4336T1
MGKGSECRRLLLIILGILLLLFSTSLGIVSIVNTEWETFVTVNGSAEVVRGLWWLCKAGDTCVRIKNEGSYCQWHEPKEVDHKRRAIAEHIDIKPRRQIGTPIPFHAKTITSVPSYVSSLVVAMEASKTSVKATSVTVPNTDKAVSTTPATFTHSLELISATSSVPLDTTSSVEATAESISDDTAEVKPSNTLSALAAETSIAKLHTIFPDLPKETETVVTPPTKTSASDGAIEGASGVVPVGGVENQVNEETEEECVKHVKMVGVVRILLVMAVPCGAIASVLSGYSIMKCSMHIACSSVAISILQNILLLVGMSVISVHALSNHGDLWCYGYAFYIGWSSWATSFVAILISGIALPYTFKGKSKKINNNFPAVYAGSDLCTQWTQQVDGRAADDHKTINIGDRNTPKGLLMEHGGYH